MDRTRRVRGLELRNPSAAAKGCPWARADQSTHTVFRKRWRYVVDRDVTKCLGSLPPRLVYLPLSLGKLARAGFELLLQSGT